MLTVALILAALAALLHVFIFYLESIAWTGPRARATFGTTPEGAQATREMAFNQGFYNLFLAISAGVGIVLVLTGHTSIGATLIFAGAGSMAAAALLLLVTSPNKRSAAIRQGIFPLFAVITLVLAL
ncbi:DUF1304 domain-containing protein [Corynebacterium pacaense]|uniref:DUF1304 domain-containing protein n=1 Tax=Corynebacterium pacaense TaxID=1816684 RepID=UPI0009B9C1CD|nr:DUF1304 domain-containing protein [Corynebacterium pacaense]